MGNSNKQPIERKRKKKKKGRPSLLDLQKRSLRLQNQHQNPNPNPNPNPYLRFPNASSGRRIGRRNLNSDTQVTSSAEDEDEDEDDDGFSGKRREKKLKLVLRIPNSTSDSDGGGDDNTDREKGEERNNSSKGTDAIQGEASDLGPTTPLPDRKLLVFILDRLQKKDTYGVYSEPVDPNELPDYHDVIKHPMDFGTVRKKLSSGAYANLEQFEKDVFLISSNAMQYNAPDTIYHRQAQAIHELAKKNFENLRQESDDNEPETKPIARRGRPPKKNMKLASGGPTPDRAASDFSNNSTPANVGDATIVGNVSSKPYNLRQIERFNWANIHKLESNEDCAGYDYGLKGNTYKYGKKFPVIDGDRRSTYMQPQPSSSVREPSILSALEGEKKQLLPIGIHFEHTYARSLARFASNLGPIGWAIAAKKIERVLSPGTKFGRGWLGDGEAPKQAQTLLPSKPPHSSSELNNISQSLKSPIDPSNIEVHLKRTHSKPTTSNRSSDSLDVVSVDPSRCLNHEDRSNSVMQSPLNGHSSFGFNFSSQLAKMVRPTSPAGSLISHPRSLEKEKLASNLVANSSIPLPEPRDSNSPDLNVRFQSPGSPVSAMVVDARHQPDLALQL